MIVFETSRLRVRSLTLTDTSGLARIVNDPQAMQYTASGVIDKAQINQFIDQCITKYQVTGFGYWAIERKDDQTLIGLCGLNRHEINGQAYLHLNYRLGSDFLGCGYATEASEGIKKYCFEVLKEAQVFAIIAPSNLPSIKVAERCGFALHSSTHFKNMDVNIYRVTAP